jgi:hypothetical protein
MIRFPNLARTLARRGRRRQRLAPAWHGLVRGDRVGPVEITEIHPGGDGVGRLRLRGGWAGRKNLRKIGIRI